MMAVFKGSPGDGIKARGEDHTHMFEGGVGGGVGPRLLHVLLPVKLRLLLLHGLRIWRNTVSCQSSENRTSSDVCGAKREEQLNVL